MGFKLKASSLDWTLKCFPKKKIKMEFEAETPATDYSSTVKDQITEAKETNCPETTNPKEEEEEFQRILVPNVHDLPLNPPSSVESNFVSYFVPGFNSYSNRFYRYLLVEKNAIFF